MNRINRVKHGLECCKDITNENACEMCPYNYAGQGGEDPCLRGKLMPDALSIIDELEKQTIKQKAIIDQYRKADGFLAAHGWKWDADSSSDEH